MEGEGYGAKTYLLPYQGIERTNRAIIMFDK
jgi:hypothetical protein